MTVIVVVALVLFALAGALYLLGLGANAYTATRRFVRRRRIERRER